MGLAPCRQLVQQAVFPGYSESVIQYYIQNLVLVTELVYNLRVPVTELICNQLIPANIIKAIRLIIRIILITSIMTIITIISIKLIY